MLEKKIKSFPSKGALGKIFSLLGKHKKYVIFGTVYAVLSEFMLIFAMGVGAYSVGIALSGVKGEVLWLLFGMCVLLCLVVIVFQQLGVYYAHKGSFYAHDEIRLKLFDAFVRLCPAYFMTRRTGDVTSAATDDVEAVEMYTSHYVPGRAVSYIVPGLAIGTITLISWKVGLTLIPFLLALLIFPFPIRRKSAVVGMAVAEMQSQVDANVTDAVQGVDVLAAFDVGKYQIGIMQSCEKRLTELKVKYAFWAGLDKFINELLAGGALVAVAFVGALTLTENQGKFTYLAILIMSGASVGPLVKASVVAQQIGKVVGSAERVSNLVSAKEVVSFPKENITNLKNNFKISFEKVSFTYPGENSKALDEVSFEVYPGEFLAIVGESGAGKSTIANMLVRAWDPDEGEIKIGDKPIRLLSNKQLSESLSYVSQDVFILNDSVIDNLRLGRDGITDKKIYEASAIARADEFIEALPEGYSEKLGDNGSRLSGGQRQRLSIARAMAGDTPIILMDEPVSNIDSVSEKFINKALKDSLGSRSIIVIAHRPSTIRVADRVLIIEKGRVSETGTFDELVAANGALLKLIGEDEKNW